MVMLIILILGTATLMLNALGSSSVHIERDKKTADALAQAKEALIGRSVSDLNLPGSLPCPDTDNDGIAELLVGNECPSYVGRLPWKTLGLPDVRDGSGERLWYALSRNFRDDDSSHINSETIGTLSVNGNQNLTNLAAIIFAPGFPICGKSHANNNLDQYLEAMSSVTATSALITTSSNDCNMPYNDTLLAITAAQVMHPVEMRIAREVKVCLDNYATAKEGKYPWAAPTKNWYQSGKSGSQFGRIPYQEPITNSTVNDFLDALANLQTKVNACITSDSSTNADALDNAGNILKNAAEALADAQPTTPAISTAATTPGKLAGYKAQDSGRCDTINGNPTTNSVQTNLNAATAALTLELSSLTAASNSDKAVRCDDLFKNSSYWQDWKNLVFYQVDDEYKPSGTKGTASIQINGAGNYRATVLIARSVINPQVRTLFADTPTGYLEGENVHASNTPTKNFIAYRLGEAGFTTVNDLVLCLDGRNKCK